MNKVKGGKDEEKGEEKGGKDEQRKLQYEAKNGLTFERAYR
jgi:hypothetical protein